jgi:hypothetical protein
VAIEDDARLLRSAVSGLCLKPRIDNVDLSTLTIRDLDVLCRANVLSAERYDLELKRRRAQPKAQPKAQTKPTAPTEIRLLRAGWNDYEGGSLLFDTEASQAVMAKWRERGLELMADYEHQSLTVPPIVAPAAAKRWVPEVRRGDFYATQIEWTAKARAHIEAGEYRYFSIAARVDPKTQRVREMINFALTNNPAANRIDPLV